MKSSHQKYQLKLYKVCQILKSVQKCVENIGDTGEATMFVLQKLMFECTTEFKLVFTMKMLFIESVCVLQSFIIIRL